MSQQPDDMRSLVDYLNKTAHAYYVLDDPLISDAEWDRLYSRLQQMEKALERSQSMCTARG